MLGLNGSGKSSLLRAIAGLWRSGHGRIGRPASGDMLFLPQRPYMLLGSLRSQLLYPRQDQAIPDAELLAVLEQVNLPDLVARGEKVYAANCAACHTAADKGSFRESEIQFPKGLDARFRRGWSIPISPFLTSFCWCQAAIASCCG